MQCSWPSWLPPKVDRAELVGNRYIARMKNRVPGASRPLKYVSTLLLALASSSAMALGLGDNPALTRLRDALDTSGFDPDTSRRAAATLLHFVVGHVSLEQQRRQSDNLGVLPGPAADLHPEVAEGDFRFGVDVLIAGLRQRGGAPRP